MSLAYTEEHYKEEHDGVPHFISRTNTTDEDCFVITHGRSLSRLTTRIFRPLLMYYPIYLMDNKNHVTD